MVTTRSFAQLLAACPELIDKDENSLQIAIAKGHCNVLEHILTLRPELISNGDRSALVGAVEKGHENIAHMLLGIKPREACEVPSNNYTLLHAATRRCSREFVFKLLRLNPAALRSHCYRLSPFRGTPFDLAIKGDLIELFQWSFSFDEVVDAAGRNVKSSCLEGYTSMLEKLG